MLKLLAPLFLAMVFFVFKPAPAVANKINFSQSILPVKFIYLDKSESIKGVWSNVDELSSVYVVKFYEIERQRELPANNSFFQNYRNLLMTENSCARNDNFAELQIDFLLKPEGFEEVRTYV